MYEITNSKSIEQPMINFKFTAQKLFLMRMESEKKKS